MKILGNAALAALLFGGALALATAPAEARATVGIGIGGGYYVPSGYPVFCDPRSRFYDPERCDYYYDYYDGPVFVNGIWLNGAYRSRTFGGHRQIFYRGGWHGGSGFHGGGFHHGGGGGHHH